MRQDLEKILFTESHKQDCNSQADMERLRDLGKIPKGSYGPRCNYRILEKVIRSQVGREWSVVYKEITDVVRKPKLRSELDRSISYVLDQERIVEYRNGHPYVSKWGRILPVDGLYVDAKGILRYKSIGKRYHRKDQVDPDKKQNLDDPNIQYYRIKGIWYEIDKNTINIYGDIGVKRQLNSDEIRKLKLND